jgi:hypothetical protein
MIAASLFGIFLIPVLYVVFRWLRELIKGPPKAELATVHAASDAPEVAPLRGKLSAVMPGLVPGHPLSCSATSHDDVNLDDHR